uniref:Uncharacterized protein n=2 Tax=Anguilla anguilla TaxID=7936 RepID=A0A0E9SWM2_ANGAN
MAEMSEPIKTFCSLEANRNNWLKSARL